MSNDLAVLRDTITTALRDAGFSAFSTIPDRVTPPCAFVSPGDPYLTREGATFGGTIARHQVVVVTRNGVNDARADDLDGLLLDALDALDKNPDWLVGDVDRPGQISINGQQHLAVAIEIRQEIRR